jgi:hypothetical protein
MESKFSVEQVVSVLKQAEVGAADGYKFLRKKQSIV